MVIGIRPVTQRSLVQTLLWSLDVVFVHLDKALFIYIISVHPADIGYLHMMGVNLRWTDVLFWGVNDHGNLMCLHGWEKNLIFNTVNVIHVLSYSDFPDILV